MSIGKIGKTTVSEREITSQQILSELGSFWGEMPGEIISFDPALQIAVIQPLYMPNHNGEPVELPVLEKVPVRFDRCVRGRFTYPLERGDKVTLRAQMRDTSRYHTEGVHIAMDERIFSLSDMEAFIDGGESLVTPIGNFDADNTHWGFDGEAGGFGVRGSLEGRIRFDIKECELMQELINQNQELMDKCDTLAAKCDTLASMCDTIANVYTTLGAEPQLINTAVYIAASTTMTGSHKQAILNSHKAALLNTHKAKFKVIKELLEDSKI